MKRHLYPTRFFRYTSFLVVVVSLACFTHTSVAQVSINGSIDVQNYVPPPWAPPYDNVSQVRYYYFPDYGFYYDVWEGVYWYLGPDGQWISSPDVPPSYAGVDLSTSFIVLIDRTVINPWTNYSYYYHNYPAHGYRNYKDIVVRNRIVTNTAPGHELVPRAFNENTNRVTFMQRPMQNGQSPQGSGSAPRGGPAPGPGGAGNYHRVVHEVPVKAIAPSMPAETRNTNFTRGYTKPAGNPAPRSGGPQSGAQRGGAQRGGGPQGGAQRGGAPQGGASNAGGQKAGGRR